MVDLLQDEAAGLVQVYTYGSMQQSIGTAGVACTAPELGTSQVCSLPFPAISTHAELTLLYLAADLLLQQRTRSEKPSSRLTSRLPSSICELVTTRETPMDT